MKAVPRFGLPAPQQGPGAEHALGGQAGFSGKHHFGKLLQPFGLGHLRYPAAPLPPRGRITPLVAAMGHRGQRLFRDDGRQARLGGGQLFGGRVVIEAQVHGKRTPPLLTLEQHPGQYEAAVTKPGPTRRLGIEGYPAEIVGRAAGGLGLSLSLHIDLQRHQRVKRPRFAQHGIARRRGLARLPIKAGRHALCVQPPHQILHLAGHAQALRTPACQKVQRRQLCCQRLRGLDHLHSKLLP